MVAMTTRAGTRRHTSTARVVDCHHSPGGRNSAPCRPLQGCFVATGATAPGPRRAGARRLPQVLDRYGAFDNSSSRKHRGCSTGKQAGPPKTALSRAALTHDTLRACARGPHPHTSEPTFSQQWSAWCAPYHCG